VLHRSYRFEGEVEYKYREDVVAYFKILTQNFSGVNVGNREKFTY
jgi:hypothetical protein